MTEITPVVHQVLSVLDRLNLPYAVGGSFASGLWGQPRQTRDMDLSVALNDEAIPRLVEMLGDDFMISQSEMEEALASSEEYRTFQILHYETGFKFDAFVREHESYDGLVFDRSVSVELFPGLEVKAVSAEDCVIQKLCWFELGNRVSDRQWNDIVQVLEVQKGRLDESYLDQWASHFGVKELLDEARTQTID